MGTTPDRKTICIIEDDEFLRDLYVELLTGEGYTVISAEDGEEGLRLLETQHFNLVLLDIMLPKIDGLDILRRLREKRQGKLPSQVVLLTNLGQETIVEEGFSLGITGYLIKSELNPDQVVKKVEEFLAAENM
ncbi:MAG TPA: response regulator [Patescibacteria group bacterium]|nr:response regulator [Patescibacteria group bacterium]